MKFALEHQNPLVAGELTRGASGASGTAGNALPDQSFSLVAISNPNVLLWALKPSEEGMGNGVIARVWNLSADPQLFSLSLATGIDHARSVTHIETDLAVATVAAGTLSASIAPSQLSTYRLMIGSSGLSSGGAKQPLGGV